MAFSSSTTRTPEQATVLGRLRPVVKQSSSAGMERSESKCLFRGRDAEIKCNATRIIKRDEILTIGQFLDWYCGKHPQSKPLVTFLGALRRYKDTPFS